MSNQPTTQTFNSNDQQRLIDIQEEVHEYRGLRTKLEPGRLTVYLIDSDKYWRKREKQNRKKKSKYDYDDEYDN